MFHVALLPFSYRTRNVIFLTQAGTDTVDTAHTRTHIHKHTHTLSVTLPPPKQQKSECVKGKRCVMVLIKTLGGNSLSELSRYAVLILSLRERNLLSCSEIKNFG